MTWKDKVWQMTLAYVGHIVWTDEDMLTKYNLKHPTTYAELQTISDTLKSNKEMPVFYAAKPQTALNRIASQIELTVGRPKHPNFWSDLLVQGKADFTTPEWIDSFTRAKDFSTKYFDPAFSGINYPTGASLFATGKYAMRPEGSFSGGDIEAAKPAFQNLGAFTAPFPTTPTRTPSSRCTATSAGLASSTPRTRTWSWSGSTSSARRRTSRVSCRSSSTTRPRTSG
jgi:raffinose/stachyose/melibiose transport system substrate-binding protein